MVSSWVATDLDSAAGRELARAAAAQVKASNQLRVAFIHNTDNQGSGNILEL